MSFASLLSGSSSYITVKRRPCLQTLTPTFGLHSRNRQLVYRLYAPVVTMLRSLTEKIFKTLLKEQASLAKTIKKKSDKLGGH